MQKTIKLFSLVIALAALATQAVAQPVAEHFYLMTFAYQSETDIRQAHTYAQFVHATGRDSRPGSPTLDDASQWDTEAVTISWLPRELPMCISCPPVPGHNYTLPETFRIGIAAGARLWQLPSIEVSRALYENAVAHAYNLERGTQWVTLDINTRPQAVNCLHAVSDVNTVSGPLYSGFAHGVPGSQAALRHLAVYEVPGAPSPRWLDERFGLQREPLNHAGR